MTKGARIYNGAKTDSSINGSGSSVAEKDRATGAGLIMSGVQHNALLAFGA